MSSRFEVVITGAIEMSAAQVARLEALAERTRSTVEEVLAAEPSLWWKQIEDDGDLHIEVTDMEFGS